MHAVIDQPLIWKAAVETLRLHYQKSPWWPTACSMPRAWWWWEGIDDKPSRMESIDQQQVGESSKLWHNTCERDK